MIRRYCDACDKQIGDENNAGTTPLGRSRWHPDVYRSVEVQVLATIRGQERADLCVACVEDAVTNGTKIRGRL